MKCNRNRVRWTVLLAIAIVAATVFTGCTVPVVIDDETVPVAPSTTSEPTEDFVPPDAPTAPTDSSGRLVLDEDSQKYLDSMGVDFSELELTAPEVAGRLRNEQCSSLIDIDLVRMAQLLTTNVFWTFHVNFKPLLNASGSAPADPNALIGCLKFYWRNETVAPQAFVQSQHWDLIPCLVRGAGIFSSDEFTESIPSSAGTRVVTPWRAEFGGDTWIQCPFNLGEKAMEMLSYPGLSAELAAVDNTGMHAGSIMAELQRIHDDEVWDYNLFEMVAVTQDNTNQAVTRQPLVGYVPRCAGAPFCPDPSWFAYQPVDAGDGIVSFESWLSGSYYVPDDPAFAGTCNDLHSTSALSVPADVQQCYFGVSDSAAARISAVQFGESVPESVDLCVEPGVGDYYLQFATNGNSGFHKCSTPSIATPHPSGPMPFWTGQSDVVIGLLPTGTTEGVDLFYEGGMFEVWIDPDSSVVPGG